jgi:hypothetical protein
MPSYAERMRALAEEVAEKNPSINVFKKRDRGRCPTQAFSEFLTNREQGDLAENLLIKIINEKIPELVAVQYGRTENLIAGDPGFKDFYEKYQDELEELGKCPDLLIYGKEDYTTEIKQELESGKERKAVISTTKKALAGLEIRSSAFLAKKYESHVAKLRKESGKRAFLSFTPKVEDLAVILKWIEIHDVPHFYVQVFFDSIYIIPFDKILKIVSNPMNNKIKYFLEKNSKNQFKSTIHISLSEGVCLADSVPPPQHKSEVRELGRGRLLYYVKFYSPTTAFKFDGEALKNMLVEENIDEKKDFSYEIKEGPQMSLREWF